MSEKGVAGYLPHLIGDGHYWVAGFLGRTKPPGNLCACGAGWTGEEKTPLGLLAQGVWHLYAGLPNPLVDEPGKECHDEQDTYDGVDDKADCGEQRHQSTKHEERAQDEKADEHSAVTQVSKHVQNSVLRGDGHGSLLLSITRLP